MEGRTTGKTSTSLPVPGSRASSRSDSRVQPREHGQGAHQTPFPRHRPREVKADATQTRARRTHAGPKASTTAGSREGMGVLGRMQHHHTRTTRPVAVNGPLSGNEGGHPLSSAPHPEDFLEEEKIVSRPFERSDRRGWQGRLCPQTCHRHSPGAFFVFRPEKLAFLPPSEGQRRPQ